MPDSLIHSFIVYKKTLENILVIAYYVNKAINVSINTIYETMINAGIHYKYKWMVHKA